MRSSLQIDYMAALSKGDDNARQDNPAGLPIGFYYMPTSQGDVPCFYCDRCKLQVIATERVVHCGGQVSEMPRGFQRLLTRLKTVRNRYARR